jgi:hypothetical protein
VLVGAGDVDRFIANLRERDAGVPATRAAELDPEHAEPEPVHE